MTGNIEITILFMCWNKSPEDNNNNNNNNNNPDNG